MSISGTNEKESQLSCTEPEPLAAGQSPNFFLSQELKRGRRGAALKGTGKKLGME